MAHLLGERNRTGGQSLLVRRLLTQDIRQEPLPNLLQIARIIRLVCRIQSGDRRRIDHQQDRSGESNQQHMQVRLLRVGGHVAQLGLDTRVLLDRSTHSGQHVLASRFRQTTQLSVRRHRVSRPLSHSHGRFGDCPSRSKRRHGEQCHAQDVSIPAQVGLADHLSRRVVPNTVRDHDAHDEYNP